MAENLSASRRHCKDEMAAAAQRNPAGLEDEPDFCLNRSITSESAEQVMNTFKRVHSENNFTPLLVKSEEAKHNNVIAVKFGSS
jgi:hypothetical protein